MSTSASSLSRAALARVKARARDGKGPGAGKTSSAAARAVARGARAVTRAGGGDTKSTIASHRWSTDMDAWVIEGTDCALEEGE